MRGGDTPHLNAKTPTGFPLTICLLHNQKEKKNTVQKKERKRKKNCNNYTLTFLFHTPPTSLIVAHSGPLWPFFIREHIHYSKLL